tara:strand:+ start:2152 stop:2574 length:423 start_codon:yes stop_codon:yes gene_type:complete
MNYKILTKYIKDLSFEIPEAKSYFLLENNIKNYRFTCDIKSKKIKENIIQVDVNLKLTPIEKSVNKNIYVGVELAALVKIEEKTKKEELEKIVLIKVPEDIYPDIRSIIVFLFDKSGFKKVNIDEKIDFSKLYETRKAQK